jgi:iron complex outermembrane receptor protein
LFTHAVYFQDQLRWGRVKTLLALRREYYVDLLDNGTADEQWAEQFAWIPRAGLVWTALPDVNLYGTYAQGFQPQSSAQIGDSETYGGPFDPLTSHLLEAGTKTDLFRKRLAVLVAAYQITQNNILVSAEDPANPDKLRQRGQERARGLELEAQGQITPAIRVNANGSWNKTEITKDSDPENIGTEPAAAPRIKLGAWGRYNFQRGALRGIGLGAGGHFVDERNTNNPDLKLPSYGVFDAAAYYNVSKFQLAFKVNNLFDETYWTGGFDHWRLFPGEPRHFYTSVAYTF